MKKTEENLALYMLVQFTVMTIAALIIWPLFDMFFDNVITNSTFHYSIREHIVEPIIFGVVVAIIEGIIKVRKDKKAIRGEEQGNDEENEEN